MRLYGTLGSPYVARVVLFARLKGIQLNPESPPGGGIKSPEFLALNPIGKMPVLEVDGFALPESEVICEFLEDAFPQNPIVPNVPADAARARLLSRFYDVYIYPQTTSLYRHANPATRDEQAVAAATDALAKVFGYIEHFMGAGPFAVGSTPTLAECGLIPAFTTLRQRTFPTFGMADPTQGNGRLAQWWQTCAAHPVCGAFMKEYAAAYDALLKMLAARRD